MSEKHKEHVWSEIKTRNNFDWLGQSYTEYYKECIYCPEIKVVTEEKYLEQQKQKLHDLFKEAN